MMRWIIVAGVLGIAYLTSAHWMPLLGLSGRTATASGLPSRSYAQISGGKTATGTRVGAGGVPISRPTVERLTRIFGVPAAREP